MSFWEDEGSTDLNPMARQQGLQKGLLANPTGLEERKEAVGKDLTLMVENRRTRGMLREVEEQLAQVKPNPSPFHRAGQ